MNMILLFTILTIVNVIIQTIKTLCTVRCSTFVSACINAIAYGLYTFVIFYTTADGMSLPLKAAITAIANFFGVFVANNLFNRVFAKEIRWKVEVSVPAKDANSFRNALIINRLDYYDAGSFKDWETIAVFCPDKSASRTLKHLLPPYSKYNISECIKRL